MNKSLSERTMLLPQILHAGILLARLDMRPARACAALPNASAEQHVCLERFNHQKVPTSIPAPEHCTCLPRLRPLDVHRLTRTADKNAKAGPQFEACTRSLTHRRGGYALGGMLLDRQARQSQASVSNRLFPRTLGARYTAAAEQAHHRRGNLSTELLAAVVKEHLVALRSNRSGQEATTALVPPADALIVHVRAGDVLDRAGFASRSAAAYLQWCQMYWSRHRVRCVAQEPNLSACLLSGVYLDWRRNGGCMLAINP